MSESTDSSFEYRYFKYLCSIVGADSPGNGQYWNMLHYLHRMEFYWIIDRDENRARDGEQLRVRFFYENNKYETDYEDILNRPCSVLEMLVALAIRIENDAMAGWEEDSPDRTSEWFWLMIRNLDILDCTDQHYSMRIEEKIRHNVDKMLERNYERNGFGGLFPLRNPAEDQRKVEIWYQMQAYFLEENSFGT